MSSTAFADVSQSTTNPNQEDAVKTSSTVPEVPQQAIDPSPQPPVGPIAKSDAAPASSSNENVEKEPTKASGSSATSQRGIAPSMFFNGVIAERIDSVPVASDDVAAFLTAERACRHAQTALRNLEGTSDHGLAEARAELAAAVSKLRHIAAYFDVALVDLLPGTSGAFDNLTSRDAADYAKAWKEVAEAVKAVPDCPAQLADDAHHVHQLATSVVSKLTAKELAAGQLGQARATLRTAVTLANLHRKLMLQVLRTRDLINKTNHVSAIVSKR